ncbi:MAG: trimethylamine methyltransferase family protein [Desulfobacula sp.]|jgi:trimethylamine--corrinoid protein Co-methyltransferase|nr:trimethylamine methyltransferase family protein [Desulfobacula sp.]
MENTYDRLQALTRGQIALIHEKSVELLEKTGFWFDSERARSIFKKHGFKVDGEIVYITSQDIEKALETVPEEFTIKARNPENDIRVGGEHFSFSNNAGAPFIVDFNGGLRTSSSKDFKNFLKLNQQLEPIGYTREMVASSQDIPAENTLLYELLWQLKLTEKPVNCVFGGGAPLLAIIFGINKKKMNQDSLEGISYGVGNYNPRSPLALENSQCDRCIDLAEWGIASCISPMPMAGMTGPVTLPGLIVLQNTEVLAPLVLSQLVSPGAPVIYGILATIADMKTAVSATSAPEVGIVMRACTQMAKFYGLPTRGDVGLSDSCCVDFQAGAESAYHFVNAIRCGVNLLPGLGSLQSRGIGSFEKLVLDAEIVSQIKRMLRPMEFTEDSLAMETIMNVGQKGNYLTQEHTFKHFRTEIYNPQIFTRNSYLNWEKNGSKDAYARANEKVKQMFESYEQPMLGQSMEKDMDTFAQAHYPVQMKNE